MKYFTLSRKGTLKWRPAWSVVEMILENRTVQAYSFSRTVNMEAETTMSTATRITAKRIFFFISVVTSCGIHELVQRQKHLHVALVSRVNEELHTGKNVGNGFVVHPGPGDFRVLGIL